MLYSLHIVIMPMCLRGCFDSQVGGGRRAAEVATAPILKTRLLGVGVGWKGIAFNVSSTMMVVLGGGGWLGLLRQSMPE